MRNPLSVSVPLPILVSVPPVPCINPETVVFRLLPPTVRPGPTKNWPDPAMDPSVVEAPKDTLPSTPLLTSCAVLPGLALSNATLPPLLIIVALPGLELPLNSTDPPLLIIVALAAVEVPSKLRVPLAVVVSVAFPAVDESEKKVTPLLVAIVALPAEAVP